MPWVEIECPITLPVPRYRKVRKNYVVLTPYEEIPRTVCYFIEQKLLDCNAAHLHEFFEVLADAHVSSYRIRKDH